MTNLKKNIILITFKNTHIIHTFILFTDSLRLYYSDSCLSPPPFSFSPCGSFDPRRTGYTHVVRPLSGRISSLSSVEPSGAFPGPSFTTSSLAPLTSLFPPRLTSQSLSVPSEPKFGPTIFMSPTFPFCYLDQTPSISSPL